MVFLRGCAPLTPLYSLNGELLRGIAPQQLFPTNITKRINLDH